MSDYAAFLARKRLTSVLAGYDDDPPAHTQMFPHQVDAFGFLIRNGRGAAYLDTGLGKGLIALHWAATVAERERKPVLIFAPLAVAQQFVREGEKFGIACRYVRDQTEIRPGINATNYDRLDKFEPAAFAGVVLDESAILRDFSGRTRNALIAFARDMRFRLCCSATPSPNDHMELGNQAEFLGVMQMNDMLQRWFINDTSEASQTWRLKRHGARDFWDWMATWAISMSKPSDLGYPDEGFALPPLNMIKHVVDVDITVERGDHLFRIAAVSSTGLHHEKRLTLRERCEGIADCIVAEPDEPWLIWCHANVEADLLAKLIPGAVDVRGSMTAEQKEARIIGFVDGKIDRLLTKPRIAGHGLNLQRCARMAFVGVDFSFEAIYQAIRRCWRFGQSRPVDVHVCLAPTETGVWDVLMRKQVDHGTMKAEMLAASKRAHGTKQQTRVAYNPQHVGRLPSWLRAG